MNSELQIFTNEQFGEVRSITKDGQPWFVAADVCKALEIGNPSQAISRLDEDEHFTTLISNESAASGKSNASFVNEAGLYTLVLGSRKPEAKAFKRWITHEVIPTIRKHGAYMTEQTLEDALTSPDFLIRLATQLKEEQEARRTLEAENAAQAQQIAADAPKVVFANAVATSKSSILVGDLAKLLRQNGIEMGQKRLFAWLRDNGYLMKRGESYNMPTQQSMERGLFEIKEGSVANPDGSIRVTRTVKCTGKGQQYFVNLFLNKASDNATA